MIPKDKPKSCSLARKIFITKVFLEIKSTTYKKKYRKDGKKFDESYWITLDDNDRHQKAETSRFPTFPKMKTFLVQTYGNMIDVLFRSILNETKEFLANYSYNEEKEDEIAETIVAKSLLKIKPTSLEYTKRGEILLTNMNNKYNPNQVELEPTDCMNHEILGSEPSHQNPAKLNHTQDKDIDISTTKSNNVVRTSDSRNGDEDVVTLEQKQIEFGTDFIDCAIDGYLDDVVDRASCISALASELQCSDEVINHYFNMDDERLSSIVMNESASKDCKIALVSTLFIQKLCCWLEYE